MVCGAPPRPGGSFLTPRRFTPQRISPARWQPIFIRLYLPLPVWLTHLWEFGFSMLREARPPRLRLLCRNITGLFGQTRFPWPGYQMPRLRPTIGIITNSRLLIHTQLPRRDIIVSDYKAPLRRIWRLILPAQPLLSWQLIIEREFPRRQMIYL